VVGGEEKMMTDATVIKVWAMIVSGLVLMTLILSTSCHLSTVQYLNHGFCERYVQSNGEVEPSRRIFVEQWVKCEEHQ
jgi:hypothetical protein